jgi:primosomal protein N' (replication factor Y) (superfamily II helicase)
LPKEVAKSLTKSGFLQAEGELKGRTIAARTTWRVQHVMPPEQLPRLGARQRALLALLSERTEILLSELSQHFPSARSTVRALAEKQLLKYEEVEKSDRFFSASLPKEAPFTPNQEQAHAIATLSAQLFTDKPGATLLHGVTGSGKTEVYLQVVQHALTQGGGALVLVPEIALTPQLVARFRARFGEGIAVLHSGLSDRERNQAWRALRRSELRRACRC